MPKYATTINGIGRGSLANRVLLALRALDEPATAVSVRTWVLHTDLQAVKNTLDNLVSLGMVRRVKGCADVGDTGLLFSLTEQGSALVAPKGPLCRRKMVVGVRYASA